METIAEQFIRETQQQNEKILKELEQLRPKDVQTVTIETDPIDFFCSELDRAEATSKKFPKKAHMTFKNTQGKNLYITDISLIPDSNFKTNGQALIKTDTGLIIHQTKNAGDFKDVDQYQITIKKRLRLKPDKEIQIFLKNDDDVTLIGLSASVQFED